MSAAVLRRYSYWRLLPLIAGAIVALAGARLLTLGQGYFFSPPVEAEEAFRQLRSGAGVLGREAADETGVHATLAGSGAGDDSPTLMLPAGMILESRITDDADALEKEHSDS